MSLSDEELLRYNRHIMLEEVDINGQNLLKSARVLLIGVGGLGSPVALYLGAAGVGSIVLVDDDTVELSNLQRQIIHGSKDIGKEKVQSAADTIAEINPLVDVTCMAGRLTGAKLTEQVKFADIIIDASDNLATRLEINSACMKQLKPLVSGGAIAWEGQISVFNPQVKNSPCYQCVYPSSSQQSLSCSQAGVISPLVGVIGSAMALEAMKLIIGVGESLVGKLLMFDAKNHQWQSLAIERNKNCPVCSGH